MAKHVHRHPVEVQHFTIWDNYERHCQELRAVGVPEAELPYLRQAAQDVEEAEQAEARFEINLARATAPFLSCTGWLIQPPTMAARYWARLALVKVTGGAVPDAVIGTTVALMAGLLILRLWGEGRRDDVMRMVTVPGSLAQTMADETERCSSLDPEKLGDEWLALMNIRPAKKKALDLYEKKHQELLGKARRPKPTTPARSSTRRSRCAGSA